MRLVDLGGKGMFIGRDSAGALTDAALAELLAASTGLVDLIRRRLMQSPEEVQKAVVLAGLQGNEFISEMIETTAVALAEEPGSLQAAVANAESPHAYLAATFPGMGAFVQSVYQEVARSRLGFWYDPDEARSALTAAVRERMNSELDRSQPQQVIALYDLAARLLEDQDDPGDRRSAAHALHWLSAWARTRGDVHAVRSLAVRLAKLLRTIPDELLEHDLDWFNITASKLGSFGEDELRRELLERALRLAEARVGAALSPEPGAEGAQPEDRAQLGLALAALAAFEEGENRRELARSYWERAAAEVMSLPALDEDASLRVLELSAEVLSAYANWLTDEGRLEEAARAYGACLPRLARAKELDPGSHEHYAHSELYCLIGLAGCAMLAGDHEQAEARFRAAVPIARELVETSPTPASKSKLVETLHRLSTVLMLRSGAPNPEAGGYIREGLALARSNLEALPGAAWAMKEVASLLEALPAHVVNEPGGLDLAWEHVLEALALRRQAGAREPSGDESQQLAKCLLRVADVAYARGDYQVSKAHMTESLELLRALSGKASAAVAVLGLMAAIPQAALLEIALGDQAAARALLDEADTLYPAGAAASPGLAEAIAGRLASVRQHLEV